MHKFIMGICVALAMFVSTNVAEAQVVREGKEYSQQVKSKSDDVKTDYTYKDTKGNVYPIILHRYTKGENEGKWGAYVLKVSAKTGKEYKYYIPDSVQIGEEIAREMKLPR